ncbi:hypothetical protein KAU34_07615 [candidate division WOR-3 bacterium]|nr:hypothetical protein [candidate division WOR-3 bacterium]MCK4576259.1 hypothetical protein [candidate division WOR-3 bacterium]
MSLRIWGPIILIALGVLFWLGKFGIIDFYWSRDWPVILIVIGVFSLINLIVKKTRRRSSRNKRDILTKLENGKIDAEEAIKRIKRL